MYANHQGTEFRAYWTDGRFGPPNSALGAFSAEFDPIIAPPGPKSPRANRIFNEVYDDTRLYPWCMPACDQNTNHFREGVNAMLVPPGTPERRTEWVPDPTWEAVSRKIHGHGR